MTQADISGSDSSLSHLKAGRSRAAVHGVLWSTLNSIAPSAVSAGVFLATSRVLLPAQFGLVALAVNIATVASAIVPAGFGDAIVQRTEIEPDHLDAAFWLCFGVSILMYGALLLGTPAMAGYFHASELTLLIPILGLRVIFDLLGAVPNAVLTRTMSFNKFAARTTAASLVAAGVCLLLLLLGFGLWALAISQLASSVTAWAASMLSVKWRPRLRFNYGALRELSQFGFLASGHRAMLMLNADQLIIGSLLGPAPLGLYGFARRIYQIISDAMAGPLNAVSYPLLASMQTEQDKLKDAYLFATLVSSVVAFPVFIGLASIAGDLIPFAFGAHWTEAIPAVQVFCAIGLLSSIGILQSALIRSQGLAGLWLCYVVLRQAMTTVYVILFYQWGINFLVFAIAVETYGMAIPAIFIVAHILRIGVWAYLKPFLAPAVASLAMFVAVYLIREYMPATLMPLRLALCIAGGALVYVMTLLTLARDQIARVAEVLVKRPAR